MVLGTPSRVGDVLMCKYVAAKYNNSVSKPATDISRPLESVLLRVMLLGWKYPIFILPHGEMITHQNSSRAFYPRRNHGGIYSFDCTDWKSRLEIKQAGTLRKKYIYANQILI